MDGERIDIEVADKVSAGIAKKLERIALAAEKADVNIEGLKTSFDGSHVASLKLAEAHNKLHASQLRMRDSAHKLNLLKKSGTATSYQLATAQNKLTAASLKVRAAEERVTTTLKKEAMAAELARIKADKLARSSNRLAFAQGRASRATKSLNTDLGMMVRSGLAIAGAGLGAREVIGLGESYTMLQNKLRNVTDTSAQLETVSKRVFDIANRTRSPVQETAQAFQRFDLALVQLGASQEESLRLTETVNKQLIVSGAATSEQASALLQLSQAFNKGKLDGDEFRSVMELMPPVADAIATQLGVARGELLKLAPDGVITAQVMRDALANAADDVDKKFAKTMPTIGQSFTTLKNKAVEAFGIFDKKYGITAKISGMIATLADNMDLLAVALATVSSLIAVAFGPQILASVGKFFALMASNPWGIAIIGLTTIVGLLAVFQDDIKTSDDGMVTLGDTFRGTMQVILRYLEPVITFFKEAWASAFDSASENAGTFSGTMGRVLRFISDVTSAYLNTVIGIYVGTFNSIKKVWGKLPEAFRDIFFLASNVALGAIEKMINGGISGINSLLGMVNKLRSELGIEGNNLKVDFQLDLSAFKNEGENAAVDVARTIKREFSAAFETEYIGKFVSDVKVASAEISKLRRAALEADESPLRKASDAAAKGAAESSGAAQKIKTARPQTATNAFANDEYQKIFDQTAGAMMTVRDSADATNQALDAGIITLGNYRSRITDLGVEVATLKLEMGDAEYVDMMLVAMDKVRDGFQNVTHSITNAFGDMFKSISDGFADSIGRAIVMGDNLGESLKNVAKNAMAQLISAIVKMGIQWAVTTAMQSAISKAAMASTATASAVAASVTASSWAPAAAMASLASFGANAAPASAGIASTTALAMGMSKVRGFESGGYTGNGRTDDIAGVVHGKEFVMDANATSRIGVNNLESLQRGAANVQGGNTNNTTNNYGDGQSSPPQINVVNVVDPAMAAEYMNSDDGVQTMVNAVSNNPEAFRMALENA